MTFVALNPTWAVPPANLAEDIAPTLKVDPHYLEKRGLICSGAQFRFKPTHPPLEAAETRVATSRTQLGFQASIPETPLSYWLVAELENIALIRPRRAIRRRAWVSGICYNRGFIAVERLHAK